MHAGMRPVKLLSAERAWRMHSGALRSGVHMLPAACLPQCAVRVCCDTPHAYSCSPHLRAPRAAMWCWLTTPPCAPTDPPTHICVHACAQASSPNAGASGNKRGLAQAFGNPVSAVQGRAGGEFRADPFCPEIQCRAHLGSASVRPAGSRCTHGWRDEW